MKSPLLILVTGGQRSGKSESAEQMALARSAHPVYIATCVAADEEMERRVAIHRRRREGQGWSTIEAPSLADVAPMPGATVLIDSATMLASNTFFALGEDDGEALGRLTADLDAFLARSPGATVIVVSDEIGLGGIGADATTRRFTDLMGLFNRHMAAAASQVYLVVAGIPMKIK